MEGSAPAAKKRGMSKKLLAVVVVLFVAKFTTQLAVVQLGTVTPSTVQVYVAVLAQLAAYV